LLKKLNIYTPLSRKAMCYIIVVNVFLVIFLRCAEIAKTRLFLNVFISFLITWFDGIININYEPYHLYGWSKHKIP